MKFIDSIKTSYNGLSSAQKKTFLIAVCAGVVALAFIAKS